jgi:hypothetical protein
MELSDPLAEMPDRSETPVVLGLVPEQHPYRFKEARAV